MAKRKTWTAEKAKNFTTLVRGVADASTELNYELEDIRSLMGDPSLVVSARDISTLLVVQKEIAELLVVVMSAQQIAEERAESAKIREAFEKRKKE